MRFPARRDEGEWNGFGVGKLIHKIFAMAKQRVSYTLDSTLETVDNAEQTATWIAAEAGYEEEEVIRISMTVRDAAIDAGLHGYAYGAGETVCVDFQRTESELV